MSSAVHHIVARKKPKQASTTTVLIAAEAAAEVTPSTGYCMDSAAQASVNGTSSSTLDEPLAKRVRVE